MIWKAGIIGAGIMGTRWSNHLANHPRTRLIAVCDLDQERATRNAEPFGATAYTDSQEMFDREHLDFVYVATPDFAHREPVVAAAEQGVNILVEKPLATTIEDAEAMLGAVSKAGVKAEVNLSNRWNPPFIAAKRVLDSGELGHVVSVNTRLNCSIRVPTERLPWAARSTVAWFLHTHTIDLATWMIGKRAVSVYATGVKRKLVALGFDTYDAIHAMVRYEDGTTGVFESMWILAEGAPYPVDFKYELICADGALYVDTHDQMIHKVTPARRVHEPTLDWSRARLEAYLDMLEHDRAPAVSLAEGVENTRILVSLHRSLETGAVTEI
jgi:predicted dehydrogenase